MNSLPVIIGMGGVNAAGRTSGHHGYRRMVLDSLDDDQRQQTLLSLAVMMGLISYQKPSDGEDEGYLDAKGEPFDIAGLEARFGDTIRSASLVRKIGKAHFDPEATPWQSKLTLKPGAEPVQFQIKVRELPQPLPDGWTVTTLADDNKVVQVTVAQSTEMLAHGLREFPIKGAGGLPEGFSPGELYNSRFQPRGLHLTVFGASDALASMGIEWEQIRQQIRPDQVGVYSGSGFGQLEPLGLGGMLQGRLQGERVSSKQLPMGINSMPTDFLSAYVLGSVGSANTSTGACASFLYNLRQAVDDIKSGKIRCALVGNAEAPINPWVMDGFGTMGALANDENLRKLDGLTPDQTPDYRRSSRPFGDNCGFIIGESAQYFVLCDDALALELGAEVYGSVSDVFVNADGFKKSITAPGVGNYLTMAKAAAAAESIVGREALQQGSFVLAHGSSTPQNRTTESRIFDKVAQAFDITDWPVAAVKAYVGHTIAPASGDQMAVALGVFEHGVLPGIKTIDKVADDVYQQRLNIPVEDLPLERQKLAVAILNSKGFGGNNASACLLAPSITRQMLLKRHGLAAFEQYQQKLEHTRKAASEYDQQACRGQYRIRYHFGQGLIDEDQLSLDSEQLNVPGFDQGVQLKRENPFDDMV